MTLDPSRIDLKRLGTAKRARYDRGDMYDAINAAIRTVRSVPLYVVPGAYGWTIGTAAPPCTPHIKVMPDGRLMTYEPC